MKHVINHVLFDPGDMATNSLVDVTNQWLIESITHGKFIIVQLAIDKVSFSSRIRSYHSEIEKFDLPMEAWFFPNMSLYAFKSYFDDMNECSLCIPKDMFLDLLTHCETLELIGIVFRVVYVCNVDNHLELIKFEEILILIMFIILVMI